MNHHISIIIEKNMHLLEQLCKHPQQAIYLPSMKGNHKAAGSQQTSETIKTIFVL
jgi:hypothetical protein